MKNKSGQVEIGIFTLLVVSIVIFSIFTFYTTPAEARTQVHGVSFLEDSYSQQKTIENYLEVIGMEVVKGGVAGFDERFKKEFARYKFEEDYLISLQKIIGEGKFETFYKDDFLEIVVEDLELKGSYNDMSFIYSPKISVEIDLAE